MEITKVIIRQIIKGNPRVRALLSIILDDVLMLHDISLIEGRERWFLSFPGRQRHDGSFVEFYFPMDNAFRAVLEDAAIKAYKETIERKSQK